MIFNDAAKLEQTPDLKTTSHEEAVQLLTEAHEAMQKVLNMNLVSNNPSLHSLSQMITGNLASHTNYLEGIIDMTKRDIPEPKDTHIPK